MKFIIVFGPQAAGKMTVGHKLAEMTGFKLFHNHMTIELLHPFFGFSAETWRLSEKFRMEIFESAAKSQMKGLIFTYVWAFDSRSDWNFVDKICSIFESQGADVYFVELEADLDVRLERNKDPHRLKHKPTKRNLKQSEENLLQTLEHHRLNSREGEITRQNYIKIDNTNVSPDAVAKMIKEKFKF